MAGLRDTTRKLAHMRNQWGRIAGAMAAAQRGLSQTDTSGRLVEIEGFGSNPGALRMYVHIPENCPEGAPLVVALHGCGQSANGYDTGCGWSRLADRYGFAVIFPEQQQANNPNTCFNWFQPGDTRRGRGEALSIRQMVGHLAAEGRIDSERVFVTGLSAGGAMATAMLASYPDVFAAGAILAGLPFGAASSVREALDVMYKGASGTHQEWGDKVRRASRHNGPWPRISIWQGTADTTVVPVNAGELVKQWTDLHGVAAAPDIEDRVDGHRHSVWRGAAGRPVVELYSIEGMGHGQPLAEGGESWGKTGPFMLEAGISSTYRIAGFFGLVDGKGAELRKPGGGLPSLPDAPAGAAAEPDERPGAIAALDPQGVITDALRRAGLLKS